MKEQVKSIINGFKKANWTVQRIEKELKFANGTLGKVVNGKAGISEYRFSVLLELHKSVIGGEITPTEKLVEQIAENNKPKNKKRIKKEREGVKETEVKSESVDTTNIPPMPQKEDFKDNWEYLVAKAKWKENQQSTTKK